MGFIRVCKEDELKEGELKAFHTNRGSVIVVRQNDEIYAFQEKCTHDDISLTGGFIPEAGVVECPAHGARFRMKDGQAIRMPATEGLETFDVRVEDGSVEVKLD